MQGRKVSDDLYFPCHAPGRAPLEPYTGNQLVERPLGAFGSHQAITLLIIGRGIRQLVRACHCRASVMSGFISTARELSRLSSKHVRRNGISKGSQQSSHTCTILPRPIYADRITMSGFHTRSRTCASQNFTMPAMSPTMTEGNIASWKVKEG